jgi:hypothetical protein
VNINELINEADDLVSRKMKKKELEKLNEFEIKLKQLKKYNYTIQMTEEE